MGEYRTALILLIILCFVMVSTPQISVTKAEAQTIVVPDDYTTIQEAIDAASEGDMINVKNGTYYEHVVVNKTILLVGDEGTTIDASKEPTVSLYHSIATWNGITVLANHTVVSGFVIRNAANFGIEIRADYGEFRNNIVENCRWAGISAYGGKSTPSRTYYDSHDNLISNNTVRDNHMGIWLSDVHGNTIILNKIEENQYTGIYLSSGANSNTIANNSISKSCLAWDGSGGWGIALGSGAHDNSIFGNNISSNIAEGIRIEILGTGVPIPYSNLIYYNNFINNTPQAYDNGKNNFWDAGYPSGGNFWNDYNGTDNDADGIGDTPYVIAGNNRDRFPLMNPGEAPPSPLYLLTVNSLPIEIPFIVNNVPRIAPWSGIYNETTSVTLVMPETHSIEGENYIWWRWSDGYTNRTRTVTMDKSMALIAIFRPEDTSLKISILSPENKTYTFTNVPLKITVNRIFFSTSYSLDGQANVTIIGNTTLIGLSEETHNIIVYIEDTPGNLSASIVHFTVDTTPPNIADVSWSLLDSNGTLEEGVKVNAIVEDAVGEVKWVALNYTNGNGTWVMAEMTNLEGNVWDYTLPAFPHGTNVTYNIVAEDKVGNTITSEELFGHPNQFEVLPEFPSWTIVPLFLIATLGVILCRSRLRR